MQMQNPGAPVDREPAPTPAPPPPTRAALAVCASELGRRLAGRGVPEVLTPAVLDAIDAAGLELTPRGGGQAVRCLEELPARVVRVRGRARTFIVEVDVGDGQKVRWLEIEGKGGGVERMAL
jgi:hypothetical protein